MVTKYHFLSGIFFLFLDPFVETNSNGEQARFYKVKSYVGAIVPKDIAGYWIQFNLCRGKNNCKSVLRAAYGRKNLNPGKIDYYFSISFIGGNDRNIYGVADWTDLEAKVKWGKYYVFYYFLGFYSEFVLLTNWLFLA